MKYSEIKKDLFEVNKGVEGEPYALAHCISADFGMGAGIVVEFNQRWNMKQVLMKRVGVTKATSTFDTSGGFVIPISVTDHNHKIKVMNLITKQKVWQKPTYDNIYNSLVAMMVSMKHYHIHRVAMPTIGCGIDGKKWEKVSAMIKEVFKDTDIEILVCRR